MSNDIEREDAFDCTLSGKSYIERLIQSVCDELNTQAYELRASHTVNDRWPQEAMHIAAKCDHLKRMAVELRKLDVVPAARAQQGEAEPVAIETLKRVRDWWANGDGDMPIYLELEIEEAIAKPPTATAGGVPIDAIDIKTRIGNWVKAVVADCRRNNAFFHTTEGCLVREGFEKALELVEAKVEYFDLLTAAPSPEQKGGVPEGWAMVPEDLRTHFEDFADAVCVMAQDEDVADGGSGYWAHQAKTVERIRNKLLTATPSPGQGQAAKDSAIQQAQIWAQEARTQKAIVAEIGALVGCDKDYELVYAVKAALGQAAPGSGWKSASNTSADLPDEGQPVMGYHPDWVDGDFCADGIRECFRFGDGTEWQSARWDGCGDLWVTEDEAPELWHPHPNPPAEVPGDE